MEILTQSHLQFNVPKARKSGTQASVDPFTALKLSAVQQVQESVFNQEGKYLHFKYKEHLKLLLADLRPAPARPGLVSAHHVHPVYSLSSELHLHFCRLHFDVGLL